MKSEDVLGYQFFKEYLYSFLFHFGDSFTVYLGPLDGSQAILCPPSVHPSILTSVCLSQKQSTIITLESINTEERQLYLQEAQRGGEPSALAGPTLEHNPHSLLSPHRQMLRSLGKQLWR